MSHSSKKRHFDADPVEGRKLVKKTIQINEGIDFTPLVLFTTLDDFSDDLEDVKIKVSLRQYNFQEWKKQETINERLDVYLYQALEDNKLWIPYYTRKNEHIYKCGGKACNSQLKLVVEKEEDKQEEEKAQVHFTTASLKKAFELEVPKITIYFGGKHEEHDNDYNEKVVSKLKGTT